MNRIDYITSKNPKGVKKVIHKMGYSCPSQVSGIADTMKLVIQKHGKVAVKELLKVHPDRKAILSTKPACKCQQEDNFCGCSGQVSSYVPQDHSLEELKKMRKSELERYYHKLVDTYQAQIYAFF